MKMIGTVVVLLSLLVNVSCGGKKGGGKSDNLAVYNPFTSNGQPPVVTTQNALFNPQTGVVELGGRQYTPNQTIYGVQGVTGQVGGQVGYGYQAPQPQIQLGTQYLSYAYQQIQMNQYAYRPAYQAAGIVKFNVRIVGYLMQTQGSQYPQSQYPQNNQIPQSPYVLVLTSNVQPF